MSKEEFVDCDLTTDVVHTSQRAVRTHGARRSLDVWRLSLYITPVEQMTLGFALILDKCTETIRSSLKT